MSEDFSIETPHGISAQGASVGGDARQRNRQPGARAGAADSLRLSPEAQKELQKLQQRDREVRAHEQAHVAAGGQYAGGISLSYRTGPDGRQYAVGGSVPMDASPVPNDPEATEEKARTVRRAALAPANPSAADQNIAAKASTMESKARSEKAGRDREDAERGGPAGSAESAENAAGADEAEGAVFAAAEPAAVLFKRAVSAYGRTASPAFGASWQSSAGTEGRDPVASPHVSPWPGPERAAAVYAAAYAGALPQTALAPWGTGISAAV